MTSDANDDGAQEALDKGNTSSKKGESAAGPTATGAAATVTDQTTGSSTPSASTMASPQADPAGVPGASTQTKDREELRAFIQSTVHEAMKGSSPDVSPTNKKRFDWVVIFGQITNPTIFLTIIGLAAFVALGVGLYASGGRFIESLQHMEIARGMITFLVTMGTVSIAIILVLYAVLSSDATLVKERFPLAKEVLTLLIGILGTILGFYYGSSESKVPKLDIGEIRIVEKQLLTRVAGGTKPYRYTIVSTENGFAEIKGVSEDGWIIQSLPAAPSKGSTITVDVMDGKEVRATAKKEILGVAKGEVEASPKPPAVPASPGQK